MSTKADAPVVLVTGAGRGIGAGIAKKLGREGYRVGVHYNVDGDMAKNVAAVIEESGGEAFLLQGDLSETEAPVRVVDEMVDHFGRLDGLVNNAGVTVTGEFLELPLDKLEFSYGINFRGPYLCSQRAAQHMVRLKIPGSIVQITSVHYELATDRDSVYGAMKSALARATQSMAYELGPHKIRVNAVAPGRIVLPEWHSRLVPEREAAIEDAIPIRRSGNPDDVAEAVHWLLTPASSYVTGITLRVDGGMNLPLTRAVTDGKMIFF